MNKECELKAVGLVLRSVILCVILSTSNLLVFPLKQNIPEFLNGACSQYYEIFSILASRIFCQLSLLCIKTEKDLFSDSVFFIK